MILYTSAIHTLGLDINSHGGKAAFFTIKHGKPRLEVLKNVDVKQLDILKKVIQQKKPLMISALKASEVLVREFEVPLVRGQNMEASLAFQAEPSLPYPIEEALLAPFSQKKKDKKVKVTVFTTKKDLINQNVETLSQNGLEGEAISCTPAALVSLNDLLPKADTVRYMIHLGREETACILLRERELLGSGSTPIGEVSFLEALIRDLNSSEEEARQHLLENELSGECIGQLLEVVSRWRVELVKTILALSMKTSSQAAVEFFITGELAASPSFLSLLQEDLGYVLSVPPANEQFKLSSIDLQTFAIAIGLAISYLPYTKRQVNFRVGEMSYAKPLRHLKGPLFRYFSACLVLAVLLFAGGRLYLSEEAQHLVSKAEMILGEKQKAVSSKSEAIAWTYNRQEISHLLTQIKMDTQFNEKSGYPLVPQVPRVSDFLAWLCNYSGSPNAADENIRVDRVSYQMTARPDKKKIRERYQVKVELEFTTTSPKTAREFHEALLRATDIINTKDQFQWTALTDKYKASFLLKDRTVYY